MGTNSSIDTYTTPEIAQIVGLPLRKVLSYTERGYIKPSIQEASGPGSKRVWSFEDLVRCAVTKILLEMVSVDAMRIIAKWMADDRRLSRDEQWVIPISINATSGRQSIVKVNTPYSKFDLEKSKKRSTKPFVSIDERRPVEVTLNLSEIYFWVDERINSIP